MNLLARLVIPAWAQALVRAAPYIVLGLLIAAAVVQRQMVVKVTAQRDRIVRVFDPTGKANPDQALVLAQRTVTERDAAKNALTVTEKNFRLATAKAQAADLAHARDTERQYAAIQEKVQHDVENRLAAARDDADRHVGELRVQHAAAAAPAGADRGGSGAAGLSGAAAAPIRIAGPGQAAELDDTRICAANTALAEGWLAWWSGVSATPR